MSNVVVWAFLTGLISGGVWVAIVLRGRQHRLAQEQRALLEDTNRRLAELDQTYERVAELEERLDFAERLLGDGRTKPSA